MSKGMKIALAIAAILFAVALWMTLPKECTKSHVTRMCVD